MTWHRPNKAFHAPRRAAVIQNRSPTRALYVFSQLNVLYRCPGFFAWHGNRPSPLPVQLFAKPRIKPFFSDDSLQLFHPRQARLSRLRHSNQTPACAKKFWRTIFPTCPTRRLVQAGDYNYIYLNMEASPLSAVIPKVNSLRYAEPQIFEFSALLTARTHPPVPIYVDELVSCAPAIPFVDETIRI